MASNTPAQAVRAYLAPLRRAASCVTRGAQLHATGYAPSEEPHGLALNAGQPVLLQGTTHLALRLMHRYDVRPLPNRPTEWVANTTAYFYALETTGGQEVLSYHWQPDTETEAAYPHFHLGPAGATGGLLHRRLHLPTGWVTLADVLWLAIAQLGVQPARRDWATILREPQPPFRAAASPDGR